MTRILWVIAVILALLPAPQLGEDATLTVDVDLVNVFFTVCNKKGNLVTDLDKDSFKVFENDTRQVITNFSQETELPRTIAVMVDTSGSVREKLRFEQEAAIDFLYATLRRGRDHGLIFTFDSEVNLRQDYTDDPASLAQAIRNMRAGGGTRLYDALYFAVEKLAGQEGRRAIVLISDGDDNSSRRTFTEAVEFAQRHDVTVYSISTSAVGIRIGDTRYADSVMKTVAQETGGNSFFPQGAKELVASFKKISKELGAQYTLGYRSTNPKRDGSFRRIRIEVDNKRYTVRARAGYYAPQAVAANHK